MRKELDVIDVVVLFLKGCHVSTAIAPMEVFHDTGVLWNIWNGEEPRPRFRVTTASADGHSIDADGPLALTPRKSIKAIRKADLILVPAIGLDVEKALEDHWPVIEWIKSWHAKGAEVAAACSGVSLLAAAGLLDGQTATTHWALAEEYRDRFPNVDWQTDKFVTDAGGIFCGGGLYSSLDLSLYIVERYCGHDVALQTARALLIDMPRTTQTGFSVLPLGARHEDKAIQRAEGWIHDNCANDFRVEDLAAEMGMSPRNFVRRFKRATGETPLHYLQKLRVANAKRMLEGGHASVQETSNAVGYDDVAFFREVFKRHAGILPNEYRHQFGARMTGTTP